MARNSRVAGPTDRARANRRRRESAAQTIRLASRNAAGAVWTEWDAGF